MDASAQAVKKEGGRAGFEAVANDTTKKVLVKGPKAFNALITKNAVSDSGLLNTYKLDDKYYFEIPDAILGREILVVSRISKSAAELRSSMMGYGGDQINESVIRFDKGPGHKIFMRSISYAERSKDSTQSMYSSLMNSSIQPIVASFDVKAYAEKANGSVIDVTELINGDDNVLFFDNGAKTALKLGKQQLDRSYINSVRSYPINVEIRTVKTYGKSSGPAAMVAAAGSGGFATLELNTSMVLLPEVPMRPRYFDPRVGYFTNKLVDFDMNPQGVKKIEMITRWKLEPKKGDIEKYNRGELVEPAKPIIFYIDPATPEKWRKYLIKGVNNWQSAFEQAGFKNAIMAKMAPTKKEDPDWTLEDARYSAIVYKPSDIPNASGPHVHDPRSGEILESHINWYHNVMKLLRNWYLIQGAPNDPRARTSAFSDELMGELIEFVSAHEVGHTLGLRHNFGSSSAYPVDKLRDKEWVKKNGHAASIMDYARFNYVAQPGDGITGAALYPKINYYDKWAIEWGYRLVPKSKSPEDEQQTLNKWVSEKAADKNYWFGTERNADDPRSQSEDLGDDAMKASAYGIKNLQYSLPKLMTWLNKPNEDYSTLKEIYDELISQFNRYMGHVVKNVAGIYETPKVSSQPGPVYDYVAADKQKSAIDFLNKELFATPSWLLNRDILDRIGSDGLTVVGTLQNKTLDKLINAGTINKLISAEATGREDIYTALTLFSDLKSGIWNELKDHSPITVYRRNLQKKYVDNLGKLISAQAPVSVGATMRLVQADPTVTDVSSIARAQLKDLKTELQMALPVTQDLMSKYHIDDLLTRIDELLNNKAKS